MRRLLLLAGVGILGLANAGCLFNQYPSDPHQRMNVLMNQSEDLRQAGQDWRRIWMNDQPSTLTPVRVTGAVAPLAYDSLWPTPSADRSLMGGAVGAEGRAMGWLGRRTLVPEVMDQPGLPAAAHEQALRALARINRFSGSARVLWPPIRRLAAQTGPPLRLLDVASGAGDVLIGLARRAARAHIPLELHGCDVSATALDHARSRAATAGVAVTLVPCDALADPLPGGFDVVTCSLFLHHLTDDQAVLLLRKMATASRRLVLVNDLRRSRPGLLLAHAACRLLTRSPVVHTDGPRSVAAAFTPGEARALAERAGLHGATVSRRWPFRFLLHWDRVDASAKRR